MLHPISFNAVPTGLKPSLALAEHKKSPSVFWQKYKPLGALRHVDVKCFTSILRSPAQLFVSQISVLWTSLKKIPRRGMGGNGQHNYWFEEKGGQKGRGEEILVDWPKFY